MIFPAAFIEQLATAQTADDAFNPYAGRSTAAHHCRRNLGRYLSRVSEQGAAVLLVGEAPGYRGCRLTGIPFTSEQILADHPHFGPANGFHRRAAVTPQREATATVVWRLLDELQLLPVLWNVYPFHPHRSGAPAGNRPPRATEITQGEPFVRALLQAIPVALVVAVGRTAAGALARWNIPATAIRHPAHGGGPQFGRELAEAVALIRERA